MAAGHILHVSSLYTTASLFTTASPLRSLGWWAPVSPSDVPDGSLADVDKDAGWMVPVRTTPDFVFMRSGSQLFENLFLGSLLAFLYFYFAASPSPFPMLLAHTCTKHHPHAHAPHDHMHSGTLVSWSSGQSYSFRLCVTVTTRTRLTVCLPTQLPVHVRSSRSPCFSV